MYASNAHYQRGQEKQRGSLCNSQAKRLGGFRGFGGRGGGRTSLAVESVVPVQHISVQRRVDLSGTLLSQDPAKVSSEVAGVVREVPVQLARLSSRAT